MTEVGVVCEFCFHGVGHGLFYTGKIGEFNFVYDCGSNSPTAVSAKVERFLQNCHQVNRRNEMVKLFPFLFISHLHHDHVSGLEALFKDGVEVDYVFLPYLSPWERLLLVLLVVAEVDQVPPWYLEMLHDPVGFFIRQGVKKVIMLAASGSGGSSVPLQFNPEDIDGLPNYKVELEGFDQLDEDYRRSILSQEDSSWDSYLVNKRFWLAAPAPRPNKISGPLVWEFVLYCMSMPEEEIKRFKEWISSQKETHNFIKKHAGNPLALLSEHSLLKKLKKLYSELPHGEKDINLTSLVLWHGPIVNSDKQNSQRLGNLEVGYCRDYSISEIADMARLQVCNRSTNCSFLVMLGHEDKWGQLLTGDLNFNYLIKNKRYKEFRQHFGDRLKFSVLCLLPHHGSKKNWNIQILKDLESIKFWIASASRRNDNYPPHWDVVADIASAGKTFIWVGGDARKNTKGNPDANTNAGAIADYVVRMSFEV